MKYASKILLFFRFYVIYTSTLFISDIGLAAEDKQPMESKKSIKGMLATVQPSPNTTELKQKKHQPAKKALGRESTKRSALFQDDQHFYHASIQKNIPVRVKSCITLGDSCTQQMAELV